MRTSLWAGPVLILASMATSDPSAQGPMRIGPAGRPAARSVQLPCRHRTGAAANQLALVRDSRETRRNRLCSLRVRTVGQVVGMLRDEAVAAAQKTPCVDDGPRERRSADDPAMGDEGRVKAVPVECR